MATRVHRNDDDAEGILHSIGVDRESLVESCRRGLAQYLTATPLHPANAAGTLLYIEMIRSLRELLGPRDWEAIGQGLELVVNENRGVIIAVSSGDIYTGNPERTPSFKYDKGPTTQAAVAGNAVQLRLFDGMPDLASTEAQSTKRIDFNKYQTWWLVHHVDKAKQEMRAELSLPTRMESSNFVNRWEVRVILDTIPFDQEPCMSHADDSPSGAEVDFEVRRKA